MNIVTSENHTSSKTGERSLSRRLQMSEMSSDNKRPPREGNFIPSLSATLTDRCVPPSNLSAKSTCLPRPLVFGDNDENILVHMARDLRYDQLVYIKVAHNARHRGVKETRHEE